MGGKPGRIDPRGSHWIWAIFARFMPHIMILIQYKEEIMPLIEESISRAGLFEQLAEEATELAHAALKMARVLRGENPTPMSEKAAEIYVLEEYSDVVLCARILEVQENHSVMLMKHKRWNERLLERKNENANSKS